MQKANLEKKMPDHCQNCFNFSGWNSRSIMYAFGINLWLCMNCMELLTA